MSDETLNGSEAAEVVVEETPAEETVAAPEAVEEAA